MTCAIVKRPKCPRPDIPEYTACCARGFLPCVAKKRQTLSLSSSCLHARPHTGQVLGVEHASWVCAEKHYVYGYRLHDGPTQPFLPYGQGVWFWEPILPSMLSGDLPWGCAPGTVVSLLPLIVGSVGRYTPLRAYRACLVLLVGLTHCRDGRRPLHARVT